MTALFDRSLLDARLRRAERAARPGADFLLRAAVDDLLGRLALVSRRFPLAVDLATPAPLLAEGLRASGQADAVLRLDRLGAGADLLADPEALPLAPGSVDLIVSALALHFANDLPGALLQARRALRPDGLFLAALLGGESLHELRLAFAAAEADLTGGAAPRVIPFGEVRDLGGLLQRAGFALPVADQDRLVVRYASPLDLMRDLRAMGAANPLAERSRRPLRRDVLFRAAAIYGERFADRDGRVRATFDIVSLSGWAPHGSQPKPLRPGSAKARLADAIAAAARQRPAR